jgi:predicted DNA-binding transcriptional regulator YafY
MPLNKEATLRYHIIDECISDKYNPYPTMEFLVDKLEDRLGKEFTVSTIQKDIKAMKEDEELGYLAPIKFSRKEMGYYYENSEYSIKKVPLHSDEIEALEFAAAIIQQYKNTSISGTFSMAVDKVLTSLKVKRHSKDNSDMQIIFPEIAQDFRGAEKIDFFVHCIRDRIPVSFEHFSYQRQAFENYIVHPYFLKEHRNKWYLIGFSESHKSLRIFGLDRIENILMLKNKFYSLPGFKPEDLFKNSIGVFISGVNKPHNVKLEFTRNVAGFIKAQPLHESQKIIKHLKNGGIITSLKVYLCPELKQLLLSYGSDVFIIEPLSLRLVIEQELKKALKNISKRK